MTGLRSYKIQCTHVTECMYRYKSKYTFYFLLVNTIHLSVDFHGLI